LSSQRLGSFEVYRQSLYLYWQTRNCYRRLQKLDSTRSKSQNVWSDIKGFYQSSHQSETLLDMMAVQMMLLRYEGQIKSLEAIQEQVEKSQKQCKASLILKRWPLRGLYRGFLSMLLLVLVSFVCLPRLKPSLGIVLGEFLQLEITRSLVVIICFLACAEWFRRASYMEGFAVWALTFDSECLQRKDLSQRMLRFRHREIRKAARICCLADWLFFIVPVSLIPILLLTIPSVAGFPVGEILILPVVSGVRDMFIEPFQYAVWAVVYSNWRSQHWREG